MPLIVLGAVIVVGIIAMLIFRARSVKKDAAKLEAQRKERE